MHEHADLIDELSSVLNRYLERSTLVVPLRREIHSHRIGAGLGSSFTHLIHEASLAGGAGGVVIQTIVRRCRDHNSIAVDVDVGRGRPPPLETRCIYSPYLFPLGSELNRSRRRCRSRSWCAAGYSGQDIDPAPSKNVVWRSGSATLGGSDMNSRVIQGCPARVDLVLQARNGRPEQRHGASDMRSCHGGAVWQTYRHYRNCYWRNAC